jgi:hypothetical protein
LGLIYTYDDFYGFIVGGEVYEIYTKGRGTAQGTEPEQTSLKVYPVEERRNDNLIMKTLFKSKRFGCKKNTV